MTRLLSAWLIVGAVALGCSDLAENNGDIIAIEVRVPSPSVVEVGQTIQLTARALDADGNPVEGVDITWFTPDTGIELNADTGQLTGLVAGQSARVQALAGTLASALVTIQVVAATDPLVVAVQ